MTERKSKRLKQGINRQLNRYSKEWCGLSSFRAASSQQPLGRLVAKTFGVMPLSGYSTWGAALLGLMASGKVKAAVAVIVCNAVADH